MVYKSKKQPAPVVEPEKKTEEKKPAPKKRGPKTVKKEIIE